mgnify:CR=1 FL=1
MLKAIRWLIGRFILVLDALFAPQSKMRSIAEQGRLEKEFRNLSLYQFEACPFCVKVRRFMKASGFSLPLRDAKQEPFRSELLAGGGKVQVPCLRIEQEGGSVQWLYESSDIIAYLQAKMHALEA